DVVAVRITAGAAGMSDGEERPLPILTDRVLVTESVPIAMSKAGTRTFELKNLLSASSSTLQHQRLKLEYTPNPAWYAVQALPYLMEFPHECAEQIFNRYYANALASHIARSDPKIKRVFEQWRGTAALDSPLMKNTDLKGILLEETPWLREAQNEAEARRRVGLLFDENTIAEQGDRALRKLREMRNNDNLWPWFPGGPGNEYISLYVATGFARLRALGVETDISLALDALPAIDRALTRRYEELKRHKLLDRDNLDPWAAHHLYTRSFFLKDKAVGRGDKEAFDYFAGQARKHWASLGSRMARAHAALGLHRLGDQEVPRLITRSLKENAVISEELGMAWKDATAGWWWWQAPIETQAMMIEAFREIDRDDRAVDDCQVWLLKQKQVQDWKTTKATADAVYALLLGGRNLLASDALLQVALGGQPVKPDQVEAGTGFYEVRFAGDRVRPELGNITLTKTDDGVAWAGLHWQYLEDMAKVTAHDATPLKLEKSLWVRRNTPQGPKLEPVAGPVKVGDELVTRVVLHTDRAMEFVHLKDLRGSGTEPVNVLSGYRWQDGFGYYEVTRDTASHFFIDRLPEGTHVFESSVRVQHAGRYQTGVAEIRCMYAPEFNAHSGSVELTVER
nr:alpha-2-macroglobulin family protein [Akkermansiaceae bacterium]